MAFTDVPVGGYSGSTGFAADLSYVGPSAYPGLYQLNFKLPSNAVDGTGSGYGTRFSCGDYHWEISLSVSQQNGPGTTLANLVQIPVAVKNGDVVCVEK
jgi:hypothetical protein